MKAYESLEQQIEQIMIKWKKYSLIKPELNEVLDAIEFFMSKPSMKLRNKL